MSSIRRRSSPCPNPGDLPPQADWPETPPTPASRPAALSRCASPGADAPAEQRPPAQASPTVAPAQAPPAGRRPPRTRRASQAQPARKQERGAVSSQSLKINPGLGDRRRKYFRCRYDALAESRRASTTPLEEFRAALESRSGWNMLRKAASTIDRVRSRAPFLHTRVASPFHAVPFGGQA